MNSNKTQTLWDPEEYQFEAITNPVPDEQVAMYAHLIAIQHLFDFGTSYDEGYKKALEEVKAHNEMIKAQCQPHSM